MPTRQVPIGTRKLTLDARPDRLDLRDRPYLPPLANLPAVSPSHSDLQAHLPAYVAAKLVLDQGQDGACTGFGLAAAINYRLFLESRLTGSAPSRMVSAAMLYKLARMYDEWPGEDYEGSSCRGALRGWHRHGVCRWSLWPYETDAQGNRLKADPVEDAKQPDHPERNWDIDALASTLGVYYRIDVKSVVDMQAAIHQNGAIYVSATVHEGWDLAFKGKLDSHDDLQRIRATPKPKRPGGHAFALVGYNTEGFVVQNSWGERWASHGFALLPYEDWLTHGNDAWVFTLGVPRLVPAAAPVVPPKGKAKKAAAAEATEAPALALRSPRFLVPFQNADQGGSSGSRPSGLVGLASAPDALSNRYRNVLPAHAPLTNDEAYRHAIVLDRGLPISNDITAESPLAAIDSAVVTRPLAWLQKHKSVKVMVYAHGGLNSEADSIQRIRVIAPYALANGIYPLFITWRSGPGETISDLVETWAEKCGLTGGAAPSRGWLDHLTNVTDRMLEPVLRGPGGAMWGQMKANAVRASADERGGMSLVVDRLRQLQAQLPKLEIHLVGHSAGSIVLGAMLPRLQKAQLKAASVRLFAPACTTRFALDHYVPAVQAKTVDPKTFHIHVLSDANELNDSVGPYRKSLLYLVSRSFEDAHKMALLGMAKCFDAKALGDDDVWARDQLADVQRWQDFWASLKRPDNLKVLSASTVINGGGNGKGSEAATHGCFDNAVDIVGDALGAIVNPDAPSRVKVERLDY
ncbi:MAG: hypothetical protein RI907_1623 [Pseudomonadota bacterium]|jgi:hypothetical protein